MVGFDGRPWIHQGGNGTAYSDLANLICTWETNPARATAARGVLTDYSGGDRGASLDPGAVQFEAEPVPRGSQPSVSRARMRPRGA